jgi:hypothetical protein
MIDGRSKQIHRDNKPPHPALNDMHALSRYGDFISRDTQVIPSAGKRPILNS